MMRNRFLLRLLGYLASGALLGIGITAGGPVGIALTVLGLALFVALLTTFRLR